MTKRFYVNMAAIMDESMDLNQWNILLQAPSKNGENVIKVIGQVKISYKKILQNAESSRSQEVNTENIKDFVRNISARG